MGRVYKVDMMKNGLWLALVFILYLYSAAALSSENKSLMNAQTGTIKQIDLEKRFIIINQKKYELGDDLIVYTVQNNNLSQLSLAAGQNIKFWTTYTISSRPMVSTIYILTGVQPNQIKK